jgi:class 3 adenylate cyclase
MKRSDAPRDCHIVVSASTRNLLHGAVDLRPLGLVPLKGKRQPIDCYEVEGILK